MLLCLMLMTTVVFAQVGTASVQLGTSVQTQKASMSIKCDCCSGTYSPEKIVDHAKACCKTASDANTNTSSAKQNLSVKCDCCNSTYSPEKIADHAKACCKTHSETGTATSSARVKCPPGTYPNGTNCYPCLGCHPCPPSYCDNSTNAIALPANQIDPLVLIKDASEGGSLTQQLSPSSLKKLIKQNSAQKIDATTEKEKVKCDCGTKVYGKDADACKRICEFLGGASGY